MPLWAMKILGGLGVLAFAVVALILFGASRYHSGQLAERVAWGKTSAAMAQIQAAQERADDRRVQQATEAYAARTAALRPIVAHSTETVIRYAQTDAGRAPCLSAERVRGIEETAAALGLQAAPAAGNAALPANAAAKP